MQPLRPCLLLPALLALASCATPPPALPVDDPPSPPLITEPVPDTTPRWLPTGPLQTTPLPGGAAWLHQVSVSRAGRTVDLQFILFDSSRYDLQVIDQPEDWSGGGQITNRMRSVGAVAGVNGGFFSPQFVPLGLMIAAGQPTGAWQQNKLLSGAVVVRQQEPQLLWNAEVHDTNTVRQLLQAGPRLVDASRPVPSLDRNKQAARTFIATAGGQRWVLGTARSTSLGELAEILTSPDVLPGLRLHRALNLDGGRSTALYCRSADGQEISQPGWSTVRNYLAILPR